MQPLFTIHAGEYLLGSYIEHKWPKWNVWVPSKDTGIDLLVSDQDNRRTVSLQAKFSKDFLPTHLLHLGPEVRKDFRAYGGWKFNREKLHHSKADHWVFVLYALEGKTVDFVIVPRQELEERLVSIHEQPRNFIWAYLIVTEARKCWETRGLPNDALRRIAKNEYNEDPRRDFTEWLNVWKPVEEQLNAERATKARAASHG